MAFVINTCLMYIIASSLFIIGIVAGAVYGFMVEKTAMDIAYSIIAGGFAGSAAGGIVFTCLYLSGQNEDENNINERIHDKNSQIDSNPVSRIEVLPEKSCPSINSFSNSSRISGSSRISNSDLSNNRRSENKYNSAVDLSESDIITPPDNKESIKTENTSNEIKTSAEINTDNDKLKKKLVNKQLIPKLKLPRFKFKTKNYVQKQKAKTPTPGVDLRNKETDRQKIKRLKKEIKQLKKNKK